MLKIESELFKVNANKKKIDDVFDKAEEEILRLLRESKQKLKKGITTTLQSLLELPTLDTFQKELLDLTNENIDCRDEVKVDLHIQKFVRQLNRFKELKKVQSETFSLVDELTKKMIGVSHNKFATLTDSVKMFLEKEIDVNKLTTVEEIFDFYANNTRIRMSYKDIQTLEKCRTLRTNHSQQYWIYKVLLLDNGQFMTCSGDKTIRIWNFDESFPEKVCIGHTACVYSAIKLRNGKLCSVSDDKTIKIWDVNQAICEKTFTGHLGYVRAVVEAPNDILISGGHNEIRFWNLTASKNEINLARTLSNKGTCLAIILLNNEEMACTSNNNINVFKIYGSDVPVAKLIGHTSPICDLLLHSDRQRIVSSSDDNTIKIWCLQNGSCLLTFEGDAYAYKMVWFKENIVVTTYDSGQIKFWNVDTGKCVKTLNGDKGVFGLAVDQYGSLLSYGEGAIITFWSS